MATKQETINRFHLYFDDGSALSSQEESDLYDKILFQVISNRPWEIYKKEHSGTQSTSVPYITLPSDFCFLTQNANHTSSDWAAQGPVVFVGSSYSPYPVVSWSDRRQYRNSAGYAYLDIVNSRLYFTSQPTSAQAVEFDYHFVPTALTSGQSPTFPARFHDIIYHGMLVDVNIIEMSDKAKSYAPENQKRYDDYLAAMAYWNSQLIQLN
jgi:hypothetical protein